MQCLTIDEAIDYTVQWYKKFTEKNDNMFNFSIGQIENYLTKANSLNVRWIEKHHV